jgi:predicted PurR-regulated permease PerM
MHFDDMNPTLAWTINALILIAMVGWCALTVIHNFPMPVFMAGIITTMVPWVADAFTS